MNERDPEGTEDAERLRDRRRLSLINFDREMIREKIRSGVSNDIVTFGIIALQIETRNNQIKTVIPT